jgi:hypothetical protein
LICLSRLRSNLPSHPPCFSSVPIQAIEPVDRERDFGLFRYGMTKDQLVETIKKILDTDHDLSFLGRLSETELETLAATIRGRVDRDTHGHRQT